MIPCPVRVSSGIRDAPGQTIRAERLLYANPSSTLPRAKRRSPSIRGVTIEAVVPQMALTTLTIYDDVGRVVAAPVSEQFGPGNLVLQWDGSDGKALLPSGVYYAKLETGKSRIVRKFVLTR